MSRTRTIDPLREKFCLYVQQYSWGRIYSGTKQELIDGGVVRPEECFPGEPGQKKHTKRTTNPDGGLLRIQRKSAQRFEAHWRFPRFHGYEVNADVYVDLETLDATFTITEERLKPAAVNKRRLQAAQGDAQFQRFMQQMQQETAE